MEVLTAGCAYSLSEDSTQTGIAQIGESSTQTQNCTHIDSSMQTNNNFVLIKKVLSTGSTMESFTKTASLVSAEESSTQTQISQTQSSTQTPSFDGSKSSVPSVLAIQIDYFLWKYAKANAAQMADDPIHRTKTVFY